MFNKFILVIATIFAGLFFAGCKDVQSSCTNEVKQCEKTNLICSRCSKEIEEANTVRILVENTNGSTTPVELRKVGSFYYGPKGERYDTLPSRKLLQSIYSW